MKIQKVHYILGHSGRSVRRVLREVSLFVQPLCVCDATAGAVQPLQLMNYSTCLTSTIAPYVFYNVFFFRGVVRRVKISVRFYS